MEDTNGCCPPPIKANRSLLSGIRNDCDDPHQRCAFVRDGPRIGRLGKFRLTASCRSSCSGSGKARRNQPGEPVANAASATFSTVNLALESRSHTTAGVFEPGRKRRPPPKRHSLVESHVRNKHLINFVVERADSI